MAGGYRPLTPGEREGGHAPPPKVIGGARSSVQAHGCIEASDLFLPLTEHRSTAAGGSKSVVDRSNLPESSDISSKSAKRKRDSKAVKAKPDKLPPALRLRREASRVARVEFRKQSTNVLPATTQEVIVNDQEKTKGWTRLPRGKDWEPQPHIREDDAPPRASPTYGRLEGTEWIARSQPVVVARSKEHLLQDLELSKSFFRPFQTYRLSPRQSSQFLVLSSLEQWHRYGMAMVCRAATYGYLVLDTEGANDTTPLTSLQLGFADGITIMLYAHEWAGKGAGST